MQEINQFVGGNTYAVIRKEKDHRVTGKVKNLH